MRNASKFKKILFRSPRPKNTFFAIIGLGLVFGFASTSLKILNLHTNFLLSSILASLLFILPALVYGILTHHSIENFHRRRAFLLSLLNEMFLFVGLLLSTYFGSFLLFLLGFTYSINILSIAGISCRKGPIPLLYPLLYFIFPCSVFHLNGVFILTIFRASAFLAVGIATLLLIHVTEYFFQLNVPASALEIFCSFLNERPKSLDFGVEIDALTQTLKIKTEIEECVITLPWLHPGPLRLIGGGSMSRSLIEVLNERGKGYFWHVPSSHEVDPSNPEITKRVLEEALSKHPVYKERATKILSKSNNSLEIYGQRLGNIYLIFLNVEGIDDFETSIFRELREKTGKRIVFVDMHHHEPFEAGRVLSLGERETEELSRTIHGLLQDLEKEKEHRIKMGMEVSEDRRVMALVEEVGDERYLFLTMNRNGIPEKLSDELKKFKMDDRFERTLFLTTDTHETTSFLDKDERIDLPTPQLVEEALKKMSKASVGLIENKMNDVKVLGKQSHSFEASVSFTMHLFPAFLILIYLLFFLAVI